MLLLALATWLTACTGVVGACVAAQRGDRAL
jgi:hypothetical protein